MPTRHGKIQQKKRNRGNPDRESKLKDKASNNARTDDSMDEMEWPMDDDDNFDSSSSDDFFPPDINTAGDEDNRNPHRNTHRVRSQLQPGNTEAQPSKTEHNLPEYVKPTSFDDRQLPVEIFKIFSNVESTAMVLKILKEIQDEEERFCKPKDEHGNRTTEKKLSSFFRERIVQHFQTVAFMDFKEEVRQQILQYVRKPILKQSSYGVLLFNSKREILAVQNHHCGWNAPKGHRKIKNNYEFETIRETVCRTFNELIRVTNRITNEIYSVYDIDEKHPLDPSRYVQYWFDHKRKGDNARCIGLFTIEIDESKLAFDLPDKYENQDCQWLKLDEVLNHRPENHFDKYYTIRPFVERLKNDLLFNDNLPNN